MADKSMYLASALVAVLLVVSVAEAFEIGSLGSQVSSLKTEVNGLGAEVGGAGAVSSQISQLQTEVASIQSELGATSPHPTLTLLVDSACAAKTATCTTPSKNGTAVFDVVITDNSSQEFPAGYGFGLQFVDLENPSQNYSFFVNATLTGGGRLSPGQSGVLSASQWPSGAADGRPLGDFAAGDKVSLTVFGPEGSHDTLNFAAS